MKKYSFKINGKDYAVEINEAEGQEISLSVNGTDYNVTVDREVRKHSSPTISERPAPHVTAAANVVQRYNTSTAPTTMPHTPASTSAAASVAGSKVVAPLPGTILDVFVNVGDQVKEGQSVVLLEAMKMENHIEADVSGTVAEVKVRKGDSVLESDILIVIS